MFLGMRLFVWARLRQIFTEVQGLPVTKSQRMEFLAFVMARYTLLTVSGLINVFLIHMKKTFQVVSILNMAIYFLLLQAKVLKI